MEPVNISAVVERQREFFATGTTADVSFRIEQLKALGRAVEDNRAEILKALKADLGKPTFEAYVSEISPLLLNISRTARKVASWAAPRRAGTPAYLLPASSRVLPEPLGVILIISPWNYPFGLAAEPLVGAIAAGNCAVLKPSEVSPRTSAVLAKLVARTYDPAYITVVEGTADAARALLDERFDHVFYTGGGAVGRLVMEAAARNLTPVTLELGGKSPCIVEPDTRVGVTARRIAWGKWFNAGQTCIAPDYLLVNRAVKDELLCCLKRCIVDFYGRDPEASPDYARIVSERHFDRVARLMGQGTVIAGGETDRDARYIAPTIICDVEQGHPVMQEEIFGPLLPVLEYDDLSEAISMVRSRPRPLALYFFSLDRAKQERVVGETTSGGACINDTMVHYANYALPFGGVGASGFGKYHGKASFDTFSNARSIVGRTLRADIYLRYPPYRNHARPLARLMRFIT